MLIPYRKYDNTTSWGVSQGSRQGTLETAFQLTPSHQTSGLSFSGPRSASSSSLETFARRLVSSSKRRNSGDLGMIP